MSGGLVERIEYIVDPSASATERMQRRAHLTNHDLRQCIIALRSAATITALQAEVERLREALEPFAKAAEAYPDPKRVLLVARSSKHPNYYLAGRDLHSARAALEPKGTTDVR